MSHLILPRFFRDETFHVRDPRFPKAPRYSELFGPPEALAVLPEEQRRRIAFVIGHCHYGIHESVPRDSAYITLIRDPVERVLSQLGQYNRMVENGELGDRRRVSLEEYMEIKPAAIENHHARFVLGPEYDRLTPGERHEKVMVLLREEFAWIGRLERFEESLILLNWKFKWRPLPCRRLNTGTHRHPLDHYSQETIKRIRALNELDLAVQEYADRRLDEELAKLPRLQSRLRKLRRVNATDPDAFSVRLLSRMDKLRRGLVQGRWLRM